MTHWFWVDDCAVKQQYKIFKLGYIYMGTTFVPKSPFRKLLVRDTKAEVAIMRKICVTSE